MTHLHGNFYLRARWGARGGGRGGAFDVCQVAAAAGRGSSAGGGGVFDPLLRPVTLGLRWPDVGHWNDLIR